MDSFPADETLVFYLYVYAKQRFAMHKYTKTLPK